MVRILALASALTSIAMVAGAQQQAPLKTPGGMLSAGTPGVEVGTTGTTYGLPGGQPVLSTPGGSIPMGAATQEDNPQQRGVRNYNNSSPTKQ